MKFYPSFIAMILCCVLTIYGIKIQNEAMMVFSMICASINASIWSVCEAIITPIVTVGGESDDDT